MKYFLLIVIFLVSFKAKSLPFEDGFTYNVLDSHLLINYWDVSCINDESCIYLARKGPSGALIYKTNDGGKTKKLVFADTSTMKDGSLDYIPEYEARRIFYFESGVAIVVGNPNVILKSNDFGETWKKIKIDQYFDFFEVEMVNEKIAILANDKTVRSDGKVHYSTDGCETWKLFPVPDSISIRWWPFSLSIQNNGDLLIGFFSKPDIDNWVMYKTNFDGSKWELMNTPPNTYKIHYINDSEWVARGAILDEDRVFEYVTAYKTHDAGKNWELKFKSEASFPEADISIFSKSSNIGYILGPKNHILKTKNMGDSWYFVRDSLLYIGLTSSITGASLPSDNVLYYTTTIIGRLVKYSNVAADIKEPLIATTRIYPNPIQSNNSFNVEYQISKSGIFRQYICDLGGREICSLNSSYKESGEYSSTYKLPDNLAIGCYWYVSEMNDVCQIQMLNVVK